MRTVALMLLCACSVNDTGIALFDDVDLMSADLDAMPTTNEAKCRQMCEDNAACVGYTWGTSRAPQKFRGSCFLKKAGFRFQRTQGFNSGIKR